MGTKNEGVKKEDRRVKRTKKLLLDALTELMMEKAIKDISVRELCERADINRGTFYIHYRDVFDMLEQVEKEFFLQFEAIFTEKKEMLIDNLKPMLGNMFTFLGENSKLCCALLGKYGDYPFLLRLNATVRERCLDDLRKYQRETNSADKDYFEYSYSFVVSGTLGIVRCWLEHGMKESSESMAAMVERIIVRGLRGRA